jgi:hypothetical protein
MASTISQPKPHLSARLCPGDFARPVQRVVVLAGPPGTGKTTLSKELALSFVDMGLRVVTHSIDDHKVAAGKSRGGLARKAQWQAYQAAVKGSLHSAADVVLIDTPYGQEKQRGYLRELAAPLGASVSILWVVPRETQLPASDPRRQWAAFVCAAAVAHRDPARHQVDGAAVGASLWHGMNFVKLFAKRTRLGPSESVAQYALLRADADLPVGAANMGELIASIETRGGCPREKLNAFACSNGTADCRKPRELRAPLAGILARVLANPFFTPP